MKYSYSFMRIHTHIASLLFVITHTNIHIQVRLKSVFLAVASVTAGLCWLKLLGFMSLIHLKFAVFIEALKLITKELQIYILAMSIFLAMFTNM